MYHSGSYTPQQISPYASHPQLHYPHQPQLRAPQPRYAINVPVIREPEASVGYARATGHRRSHSEAKVGWVSPNQYVPHPDRKVKTTSPANGNALRISTTHGHRRSTSETSPLTPLPPNTTPPPSPHRTSAELYPSPYTNGSFAAAQDSKRHRGTSPPTAPNLEGIPIDERIAMINQHLQECLSISDTLRTTLNSDPKHRDLKENINSSHALIRASMDAVYRASNTYLSLPPSLGQTGEWHSTFTERLSSILKTLHKFLRTAWSIYSYVSSHTSHISHVDEHVDALVLKLEEYLEKLTDTSTRINKSYEQLKNATDPRRYHGRFGIYGSHGRRSSTSM